MDHTLIPNHVIKENVPDGRNQYDGWLHKERGLGLNESAGRLRKKRIGSLSDLMKLCYNLPQQGNVMTIVTSDRQTERERDKVHLPLA